MKRKGGLGRGLESLIPNTRVGATNGEPAADLDEAMSTALAARRERLRDSELAYHDLPLDLIDPNPHQPRGSFDEQELAELTASVRAVGVLQPVVVRPLGARFQLVMGERRVRAAKAAGLATIPAVVRDTAEENLLRDALLENIHRTDLNPLEEAAAYEQLLADFGVTHDDLAARLGKSRPAISNALRLLRLPASVQRRVAAGTLSAGHARAVASLPDLDQQERLADKIVSEGLTVRQAEELVKRAGLGDGVLAAPTPEAPKRPRPNIQAPGIADLAERLSDRLDTRVRVQLGKRKGKVLIEFASLDDLQRIVDAIGGGSASVDEKEFRATAS
jgi:ParB family transcriptional regulator, chromosome partitioning protein